MKRIDKTKNLRSEQTANRIFHQAIRLFLEKGYHGTTIDDITQAAGLTKGALYWHFKSKEDLLKKLIREYEEGFLDKLIQAVAKMKDDDSDKFREYIRFNASFGYENRELCVSFSTLAAELVGAHHPIEPEIRRVYKKYQKFLSGLISHEKRRKEFRKDIDPDLAALAIMAFNDGILIQWSMNRDKVNGTALVRTVRGIMLNGLRGQ